MGAANDNMEAVCKICRWMCVDECKNAVLEVNEGHCSTYLHKKCIAFQLPLDIMHLMHSRRI